MESPDGKGRMAIFNLPQIRHFEATKHNDKDVDPYINESLVSYIRKFENSQNEPYTKLPEMCNMKENIDFFKHIEVFKTFPFKPNMKLHYFNTEDHVRKAANLMYPTATEEVLEGADLVVSGQVDFFSVVKSVAEKLKKGGNLIVPVKELFSLSSVQTLYLLCYCFTTVNVYAPLLHTGQTKFIVATHLKKKFTFKNAPPFTMQMSQLFLVKLIEINTIIGQKRLEQIRFNTCCDYECAIWRSKFLNGVDVYTDGGVDKSQQTSETPHGDAVM